MSFPQPMHSSTIGLSLIFALGHLRVSPGEGRMEIGLPSISDPTDLVREQNLAFHRFNLWACLKCQGKDVPFHMDTGSNDILLFDSFSKRFPEAMSDSVLSAQRLSELGGRRTRPTVTIPQLALGVGNRSLLLHNVNVYSRPGPLPSVVGRVGGILLLGGYELDFHRMLFSLLAGKQPGSTPTNPPPAK